MSDHLSDADLASIEHRLTDVLTVAPAPWMPFLETRAATGGESFVQFQGDPDMDNEMYLSVHFGPERLASPDPRFDLIVDFVGHAADDVARLLREVRRLGEPPG